jgi:predicted RNA-binding Zn-ribbon protein involved in translation (DUF1610 family)
MEMKRPVVLTGGRTMDGAFGFSLSIGLGLILFIGGLVISVVFGDENSVGLLFGIPMIIAGVVIPLFMMRGHFASQDIVAPCPACGTTVKTSDGTLQLDCPSCEKVLVVKSGQLFTRS